MERQENRPCYDKEGNMIGWLSRSVAVATALFIKENGEWYVLVSERGPGTPDPEYIGAYNAICGYLDYGETIKEAAYREIKEECGVSTQINLNLLDIIDDPEENKRQNIVFRMYGILNGQKSDYEKQFSHDGNEPGEVGDIRFIPVNALDTVRWAFGHKQFILSAMADIDRQMNP
ncbi:MAG: MutT/NUDIX hydrolase [Wendovervirus sonii]|uniref:MutT/NUDIX hydrolase n=1 Tax=phage Lak_Megaphage_Sonny TaxID=3109229 RepID=A0ABZ0Z2G6_9CAUD|nr:MAG: MutT/NUDIX hydrolase [phage Lak_Megaphage_Sonny]